MHIRGLLNDATAGVVVSFEYLVNQIKDLLDKLTDSTSDEDFYKLLAAANALRHQGIAVTHVAKQPEYFGVINELKTKGTQLSNDHFAESLDYIANIMEFPYVEGVLPIDVYNYLVVNGYLDIYFDRYRKLFRYAESLSGYNFMYVELMYLREGTEVWKHFAAESGIIPDIVLFEFLHTDHNYSFTEFMGFKPESPRVVEPVQTK